MQLLQLALRVEKLPRFLISDYVQQYPVENMQQLLLLLFQSGVKELGHFLQHV